MISPFLCKKDLIYLLLEFKWQKVEGLIKLEIILSRFLTVPQMNEGITICHHKSKKFDS